MIGLNDSSGHISGVYDLRIKMAAFVLIKYFVVVVVIFLSMWILRLC